MIKDFIMKRAFWTMIKDFIMKRAFLILGIAYIAIYVIWAWTCVGDIPINPYEPYSWQLPFVVLIWLLPCFMLGYCAGKDANDE